VIENFRAIPVDDLDKLAELFGEKKGKKYILDIGENLVYIFLNSKTFI